MPEKTAELRTFKGCTECVVLDAEKPFSPAIVLFDVNEETTRVFVLVQVDGSFAVYQETEHSFIAQS